MNRLNLRENRFMIRHGKNRKGQRNRTLVTYKSSYGIIFFGISQCNLKLDKWDKEKGVLIAKSRLLDAMCNVEQDTIDDLLAGNFPTGTFIGETEQHDCGAIVVGDVKSLIIWFRDVLR